MKDRSEVAAKIKALMEAPSCCAELKALCNEWLTAKCPNCRAEISKKLIAEMEADLTDIDGLIAFASSPRAAELIGAEAAANMVKAATKAKGEGEKYCICDACQLCAELLEHKDWIA